MDTQLLTTDVETKKLDVLQDKGNRALVGGGGVGVGLVSAIIESGGGRAAVLVWTVIGPHPYSQLLIPSPSLS